MYALGTSLQVIGALAAYLHTYYRTMHIISMLHTYPIHRDSRLTTLEVFFNPESPCD